MYLFPLQKKTGGLRNSKKHCTKLANVPRSNIGLLLLRFYSPFQDGICLNDVFFCDVQENGWTKFNEMLHIAG